MTGDKTERAVQGLLRKQNGHTKTTDDLYTLILAVNDDGEDRHEETLGLYQELVGALRGLKESFDQHCNEGSVRDRRISQLEQNSKRKNSGIPPGEPSYTKEQIVSTFWLLVGAVSISGGINAILDLLFKR